MTSEQRARAHERLAEVEEETEQRMHSVAESLPDTDRVHERADALSDRARGHAQRARALRRRSD
jgi:hypothetical protein